MVIYENMFIDCSTPEMYQHSPPQPPQPPHPNINTTVPPGMFNISTTVITGSGYEPAPYYTMPTALETTATPPYAYDTGYRPPYWHQQYNKDDQVMTNYQHTGWNTTAPYQTNIDTHIDGYKYPVECYNPQIADGHMVTSDGQYAACGMAASPQKQMSHHQQLMEEELMLKERQQLAASGVGGSYTSWIQNGVNTSNCEYLQTSTEIKELG